MSDQQGFIDTLVALAGKPGSLHAEPYPASYVVGNFNPPGQRITLSGMVMDAGLGASPTDIKNTRWAAAHEWGHLLTHNNEGILQAFMNAAPLPRRLLPGDPNDPTLTNFSEVWNLGFKNGQQVQDTSRKSNWGRQYVAGEAFSDMFATTLAKFLPGMSPPGEQYPMTPQFRGQSRQRMMDSLVATLLPRLK
jgi:hypothetical protein